MFSHPELSSDPPYGSDRESGCDSWTIIRRSFIFIEDGMEQGFLCIIVRFSTVVALNK